MFTLQQVADRVGKETRAVRYILSHFDTKFLQGHIGKAGNRNLNVHDDFLLQALIRVTELEKTLSLSVGKAVQRVMLELQASEAGMPTEHEAAPASLLVEDLRRERDRWQREAEVWQFQATDWQKRALDWEERYLALARVPGLTAGPGGPPPGLGTRALRWLWRRVHTSAP